MNQRLAKLVRRALWKTVDNPGCQESRTQRQKQEESGEAHSAP
jgi:hypothetical protein